MLGAFLRGLVLLLALPLAAAAAEADATASAGEAAGTPASAVDLNLPQAVLDLGPSVSPRKVPDRADPTGAWFTLGVQNRGSSPVARVLTAAEPIAAGLEVTPMHRRPSLIEA